MHFFLFVVVVSFTLSSIIDSAYSWHKPVNDTIIIDKRTKLLVEKIGKLLYLTETTGIAITIPIFQFGCDLLPPKFYRKLKICTDNNSPAVKKNLAKSTDQQNSEILLTMANSSKKSFNDRFMDAWDNIDSKRALVRNKRQGIEYFSLGTSVVALGTSAYNSIQISSIKDTQQQLLDHILSDDKILQSTVANLVSLADTGNAIVEELNQTRHSMTILQDRLVYFYNHMKTLQNVVNIVVQQSLPTIENEIYYDKIHQSLDDLVNGKKNFDYLSRDELRQVVNTLFQRSDKILALFDMPLMTLINRLIASQSFYFVLNTDNGTNGNNPKTPNGDIPVIYFLGKLIISNVVFIPRAYPYIVIYCHIFWARTILLQTIFSDGKH
ncbi:unnamed protein product [Didymodactylos carnosus]|uniref:Uncharacterized protein n=1 Tax=Didymodactylos carnosus TaxID=1234261 RepID=A0A814Y7G3_9BILA|nr:unnamed protein product [Didymodactylos carnosus]CAF3988460.1 unnamed protein product [Didymodactylos carnosus]